MATPLSSVGRVDVRRDEAIFSIECRIAAPPAAARNDGRSAAGFYPEETGEEEQKTSSVRRGHMIDRSRSLIFQKFLPELAPCHLDRLSRHHRAGPSASLDKSVALFSCRSSLYHRRRAVSIGNLHETGCVSRLATCPTPQRGDLERDRLAVHHGSNFVHAGSGAGFGLLPAGVGASGAGLLGFDAAGGVPLGLSSFGSSSPFHTFSNSS